MIRIALLALVLAAGCNDKRPEERKLPPTQAGTPAGGTPAGGAPAGGTPTGTAGSGGTAGPAESPSAGPAAPGPKATGFLPFDEALAGTKPWVAEGDKAGVVELVAVEDLSGQTKGRFSVERRCGADAVKAVEAVGKQMPERLKTNHEAPTCKEDGGIMRCAQPGLAEGDVVVEIEYAKAAEAWRVMGVKTYGVGMTITKEAERYAALLKEPCK
ncbi:MAG TPA: hypothetical protein VNO30_42965 [Kofleriaceae bacterium]|nr:hypothetical protein [Kofleriaceae bacterium]